jgi:hypothetical protein
MYTSLFLGSLKTAGLVGVAAVLAACANMTTGIGISLPIGGFGSIGVGVNSNGTVGGSVGVGVGPATVSVGTSGQLPSASPASAPASAPVAPAATLPKADDKPADKASAQR